MERPPYSVYQAPEIVVPESNAGPKSTVIPSVPIQDPQKGEIKTKPFTADYFNVQSWIDQSLMNPTLDVYGIRDKVSYIEDFVSSKITEMGIPETKDSYDFVISELEKGIGLKKNHEVRGRIERLWQFLRTSEKMNKTAEAERKKISALNAKFAGRRNERG